MTHQISLRQDMLLLALVSICLLPLPGVLAASVTFAFDSANDNQPVITQSVDGVTISLWNCSKDGISKNFAADDNGLKLSNFSGGTGCDAFNLSFDRDVQLQSYSVFLVSGSTNGWFRLTGPGVSSDNNPLQPTGTYNFNGAPLAIAAGDTLTVTITGRIVQSQIRELTLLDWTPIAPQLVLAKSAAPSSAKPGQAITYTLAFSNTGDLTATQVVLTDIIPLGVVVSNWQVSPGVSVTRTASITCAWAVQDLVGHQGGIITLSGTLVKPLAAGVLTNTATMVASGTVAVHAAVPLTVQNVAPLAYAGPDQKVGPGEIVQLNGSGSTDDNGDTLTYSWAKTGGPDVLLIGANTATAMFTASLTIPTTYTLTLTVSDGSFDATDVVIVTVNQRYCYLPFILKNHSIP